MKDASFFFSRRVDIGTNDFTQNVKVNLFFTADIQKTLLICNQSSTASENDNDDDDDDGDDDDDDDRKKQFYKIPRQGLFEFR